MSEFAVRAENLVKSYGINMPGAKQYALGGKYKTVPVGYSMRKPLEEQQELIAPGLSVEIPAGRLTGFVGRNGAGKTTFMRIIAGQMKKTSGTLDVLGGGDPMNNLAVLKRVAYLTHDMPAPPDARLFSIFKSYAKMFDTFDHDFALRLLKYFGLNETAGYSDLSQGQKSVFNFSCGLACRAELTLLDEPVNGMDVPARRAVNEILLRDYSDHPRTIIVSSHLLGELDSVLYDVIVIHNGEIALYETLDDMRQSSYLVSGDNKIVDGFTYKRRVVYYKHGKLGSTAVMYEALTEESEREIKRLGLTVMPVPPEDLCMYLTGGYNERGIEKIWDATN